MAPSHDIFDADHAQAHAGGANPGDPTAVDIGVALPEYLHEVQKALEQVERSFRTGDRNGVLTHANEGIALLRVHLPKLDPLDVPGFYEAFFRCHSIQPEFQKALRLFKEGMERRGQSKPANADSSLSDDEWRRLPLEQGAGFARRLRRLARRAHAGGVAGDQVPAVRPIAAGAGAVEASPSRGAAIDCVGVPSSTPAAFFPESCRIVVRLAVPWVHRQFGDGTSHLARINNHRTPRLPRPFSQRGGGVSSEAVMCQQRWFFRNDQEWNHIVQKLKLTPCPHCKAVGTLIRHGALHGYGDGSRPTLRARRLFCNNRTQRPGCGRTTSVWLADILSRLSLSALSLWQFLMHAVGTSIAQAGHAAAAPRSLRTWQRLWQRFQLGQSHIRTALMQRCPPPELPAQTGRLAAAAQVLAHLRAAFPDTDSPIAAFQRTLRCCFV